MKFADIVILAGQSNAVGVGHLKCLPKHFSEEKIKEFYDGYEKIQINYYSHDKRGKGFSKTTVGCTEKSKQTLGPEVGMAEYFNEKHPEKEIFIVKCAFGGTNLANDWLSKSSGAPYSYEETKDCAINKPGRKAGWCYNELIKILGDSIATLRSRGYEPRIKAFCWMQGESDAGSVAVFEAYAGRYDNLLKDIKSEFGGYMTDCRYIDAGIGQRWTLYKEMNAFKAEYAKTHENCVFIDTVAAGLTTTNEPEEEPDTAHYDSDSTVKLGRLFAEQVQFD